MNAIETNAEVIEQLARGDTVTPRETLKAQVLVLLIALDGQGEAMANLADQQRADAFLESISEELEGFLAVCAPLLEYAGRHGQESVLRGLADVAHGTSTEPNQWT